MNKSTKTTKSNSIIEIYKNKVPKYIQVYIYSIIVFVFFPFVFFENELAMEKYFDFLLAPYLGLIIITPIIIYIVKLFFREKLSRKHVVIGIVIRAIPIALVSSSDFIALNLIVAFFGLGTVYFAFSAYLTSRNNLETDENH